MPAPATGAAEHLIAGGARAQRPERHALERSRFGAQSADTAQPRRRRPQLVVAGGYDYARPNPRIFPRADAWEDSWDVVRQRELDALGRRPPPRRAAPRPRRGARPPRRAPRDFDRQVAFEVRAATARSWTRAAPPSRPPPTASAPPTEADRVVGERSAPASRPAPTCSTRRSRCCRRSWIARARSPARGSPTRGWIARSAR